MFNFREIFKRAFKIYGIWPQARSYTHTSAQRSPASVGLAQARPNKTLPNTQLRVWANLRSTYAQ